jgi:hypothetical protein
MMSLALLRACSDKSALVCARMADALTRALEEPEGSSPVCWSSWSSVAAKRSRASAERVR